MAYWQNKIVVVTGGSEGLGREIALAYARQLATVILLARNEGRLQAVVAEAKKLPQPLDISSIVADVTDDASIDRAVNEIIARHGRIDVWVNNVGKSARTALTECGVEQYRELMEINFYSAVRCTLAVLPQLEETAGQLINIGSLASKTGWPHVAPYATSKHALAAFTHQLRLEGPASVNYLHVCSGPIQRSDSEIRYEQAAAGLEKSAAQPGAGVKLKGIPPRTLAEKIERASRRRKIELIVPGYTRFIFALAQLFPYWSDKLLLRSKK